MVIGERLRDARTAAGLTQRQVADRSGLQQPTISDIERGVVTPRAETAARISRALRRRPSAILSDHREQVIQAAARRRAADVRVFGSVAHDEDTVDSDIDLLVTFQEGASYFDAAGLRLDLEELLGLSVDIVSDEGQSPALERARADAVAV